jgi:hypothetical protein
MWSRTGKTSAWSVTLGRGRTIPVFVAGTVALVLTGSGSVMGQGFRADFGGGEGGGYGRSERSYGERGGFTERGGLAEPRTRNSGGGLWGKQESRERHGSSRTSSWRRPVRGCDLANCGWDRGGVWRYPIARPGIFLPPGVYIPPPEEGVVEGEPGVPHWPPRHTHPLRPVPAPSQPYPSYARGRNIRRLRRA